MVYFNNKFRKILFILTIIILFCVFVTPFTKVFAAFSEITYENYKFPVSDHLDSFYLLCLISNDGRFYHLEFIISEQPAIVLNTYSYGYRVSIPNGTKWNGMSSNSTQVDTNFFNNTTINPVSLSSFEKYLGASSFTTNVQVWANYNVKDSSGNVIIPSSDVVNPYFNNKTEIENGYPDGVYISRGSYSENDTLYFHLLKITYTVTNNNETIYYYSPKVFALSKNSKYYRTWDKDTDNQYSYYVVDRSSLSLDTNSSYLYVLSNSSETFTNSNGILTSDVSKGIYEVLQSDTTGVITSQDSTNDKIQNIDDTLNDNTVSSDTESDIEDSLNFDNQNDGLNNLNNGFFSRLSNMLSNLLDYNLDEDTSVSIPLPNSNKSIVLHSKSIYDNVTGVLRLIINAFWLYIFSFYMWKFINKIYIAVSTGNILDTFSSSGEAITNDML